MDGSLTAFYEMENAWGKGNLMRNPVLASLSLGDLCDICLEKSKCSVGWEKSGK